MGRKAKIFANLRVGQAQVHPSRPSHVRGVREGNRRGNLKRERGIEQDPDDPRFAYGTAERSTGINPHARNPIDPRMPNLSPS
jgi:hypothetical protein